MFYMILIRHGFFDPADNFRMPFWQQAHLEQLKEEIDIFLQKEGIRGPIIFICSPQQRTRQTLEIICSFSGEIIEEKVWDTIYKGPLALNQTEIAETTVFAKRSGWSFERALVSFPPTKEKLYCRVATMKTAAFSKVGEKTNVLIACGHSDTLLAFLLIEAGQLIPKGYQTLSFEHTDVAILRYNQPDKPAEKLWLIGDFGFGTVFLEEE